MTQNVPVWTQMALKHFPLQYYVILCHAGPPWGFFRGPLGPCGPLKRPQGGPICHIIMYYAPEKCFRTILGMQVHFGSWWHILGHEGSSLKHHFWSWGAIFGHKGPFWCCFRQFWGPLCLWKGPRVTWHDIISSNIPMRSFLGTFWVMQGHFGSLRAIFGHEGSFWVLFWAIMGPPRASEKGPGWSNMTYNHVIYPWEVF